VQLVYKISISGQLIGPAEFFNYFPLYQFNNLITVFPFITTATLLLLELALLDGPV